VRFVAAANRAIATCNARVAAEDNSTPAVFSTYADFNGRVKTTASVDWNAVPAHVLGTSYDTPDITTVVQEVVDRADWATGNNMVVFVANNSSTAGAAREEAAFENVTYAEPELHILYEESAGQEATCDAEVYIANKHNTAQLTHIFVDDGGVFGANLLAGNPPYSLFPAVPAVGDAVYFGIDTTHANSGPFDNLVFDLSQATDIGGAGLVWEVWDGFGGAWATTVWQRDNTNGLRTAGVGSYHRRLEYDAAVVEWQPNLVNGVTAYWLRLRTLAVGTQPAIQQTRHVYTCTWPYVDTSATAVTGDIDALARIVVHNQSAHSAAPNSHMMNTARVIAGLRSLSRGTNYSAYLNASDEQNPTGLTAVLDAGTCSFFNWNRTGTGRCVLWNPAGVVAPAALLYHYTFTPALAEEYYGRYHAFLRMEQIGGAAEDFSFYAVLTFSGRAIELWRSPTVTNPGTAPNQDPELLDLGPIDFSPDVYAPGEQLEDVYIDVYGANTNAAPGDAYIYEVILMPVDERAFDTFPDRAADLAVTNDWNIYSNRYEYNTRLNVDGGVIYPKRHARAYTQEGDNDYVTARWQVIAPGPPILHPNVTQRWWFLMLRYFEPAAVNQEHPYTHIGAQVLIDAQRRYLLPRGAR
jgi:hypothetical protein